MINPMIGTNINNSIKINFKKFSMFELITLIAMNIISNKNINKTDDKKISNIE